jgi:enamine deaminase RidA (YjgF/YER057c/UK114 family)
MPVERLNPATLSRPTGYSHIATVSGRQAHVSGQVALDPSGALVGAGDLTAQTEQVYANLGAALAAVGASWADVAKVVTYVVGLTPERAAAVRAVRMKHVGPEPYPASTMVGISALVHPDMLIEIEIVVALP